MTDLTNLFKATVKTVKSRLKSQGVNIGPDKSILSTKNRSQFVVKAKDVVNTVTQLKEFLLKHRKDYIDASGLLGSSTSTMTDSERDQIDVESETLMKTCSEAIRHFKKEALAEKIQPQVREHRETVFYLMEKYLKVVCQIYSEARAIRVKRVVDRKRISRLENRDGSRRTFASRVSSRDGARHEEGRDKQEKVKDKTPVPEVVHLEAKFEEDEEITAEEAQMFAQENQQLYEEMNSTMDEVRQIEGKVVEISKLQEIFADKILEQEADVNRIEETVVGTVENIIEGNEDIRKAMKNNAGLRVWILFFLIVCSLSLLFLDWYNP